MFYLDPTYLLILPAFIISLWASYNVNATFKKYSKVPSENGMTGYDAARKILDSNGLRHIDVIRTPGNLTDHYDPKANVIRLSDSVYGERSAAAVGVAAHEAGHAVQHAVGYGPIKLRMAIVNVTNIGSNLSMPLFFIGLLLSSPALCYAGIALFSAVVFFQLVTLPVEFNASRRALDTLKSSKMQSEKGLKAAKKVLSAAALTYVAALMVSLSNLLRLLVIANGRRRD
ncbi:MAG: zinc metallopeptidase [Clostridia bacterium]|nr:zinc metallopeptidase [Clostridia bacterium]